MTHSPPSTTDGLPPISDYREQIERALEHCGGTHTVEDVYAMCERGAAVYWPVSPDTVVITEIVEHPRKRVLHFFLVAGKMEELERVQDALLEWGRLQGCVAASLVGRRGWGRSFLARTHWRDTRWVTMYKDL